MVRWGEQRVKVEVYTAERRAQAQDLAGKEVDEEYKEEISVELEDDLQLEQRKQDCL